MYFELQHNSQTVALVFLIPLPRLRLERQMESGEDCLNEVSSAAAQMRR
jgi:hypothetical protein